GVGQVERGVALADLAVEPDAVHATLRAAGGAERRVRAAFLVGADGTRSTVRAALGIGTRGPGHIAHRLAIQFRAPELWRALGPRRHVVYEVEQPEPAWLIPAGADDRWVYVREWDPAGDDLATWTPDE